MIIIKNVNAMGDWRRVATSRRLAPGAGLTGRRESVPGSAHGGVVCGCRSSIPMFSSLLANYRVEKMLSEVENYVL